jgi:hypothetical protein
MSGLKKIEDEKKPCFSPEHNPPSQIVLAPGTYEYVCPSCGERVVFTVPVALNNAPPTSVDEAREATKHKLRSGTREPASFDEYLALPLAEKMRLYKASSSLAR